MNFHPVDGRLCIQVATIPPEESQVILVFFLDMELVEHTFNVAHNCHRSFTETAQYTHQDQSGDGHSEKSVEILQRNQTQHVSYLASVDGTPHGVGYAKLGYCTSLALGLSLHLR